MYRNINKKELKNDYIGKIWIFKTDFIKKNWYKIINIFFLFEWFLNNTNIRLILLIFCSFKKKKDSL